MLSLCYSKPGRPGRILTLDAAPRHAGDDLLSEDQEENQHGYNDDRSAGHLQIYLGAHRIPEVEQTDGHNLSLIHISCRLRPAQGNQEQYHRRDGQDQRQVAHHLLFHGRALLSCSRLGYNTISHSVPLVSRKIQMCIRDRHSSA